VSAAAVFGAVFAAYFAGHQVADFWVQTSHQALCKGLPGREGRRACAAHVAVYTAVLAVFLAAAAGLLGLPASPGRAAAGLAAVAVTHYLADRRRPLERLARLAGKDEFWDLGDGLSSGAAAMDQSFHVAVLFAAALITAGGVS
jgi:hypothetical protein